MNALFAFLLTVMPAVVNTTTHTVTYSPAAPTSTFSITFPFITCDHIRVIKITEATNAEATLTQGTQYTCFTAVGATNGYITTSTAVTSSYTIRIERHMDLLQSTSFRSQGSYSALTHERAFDKLTMIAQQLADLSVDPVDIASAISTHEGASDPHSGYFLLAGRAGGQTGYGGTATTENLVLVSNTAADGHIYFGAAQTSGFTESTDSLTVGGDMIVGDDATIGNLSSATTGSAVLVLNTATNSTLTLAGSSAGASFQLNGGSHAQAGYSSLNTEQFTIAGLSSGNTLLKVVDAGVSLVDARYLTLSEGYAYGAIYGSSAVNGDIYIYSTTNGAKGNIFFGTSTYDELNNRLGLGTTTPGIMLDVRGLAAMRQVNTSGGAVTMNSTTHCGGVFALDNNPSTATVDLPQLADGTNDGCTYTFINVAASASRALDIRSDGTTPDNIYGVCGAVDVSGGAAKDIRNTAATHVRGDSVTLTAVLKGGVPGWYVIACTGVWAAL